MPQDVKDLTAEQLVALRSKLFEKGLQPLRMPYVDETVESIYEFLPPLGTVETTPSGDRFLIKFEKGVLLRDPLPENRAIKAARAGAPPRLSKELFHPDAGIVVTDLSLTPIAVDRGAAAILHGAFIEEVREESPSHASSVQLPNEVLELARQWQSGDGATGETTFFSLGTEYVCRVFQIEPQNSLLQQPVLVLHFEKGATAPPDAVYRVAADYGLTDREQEALVGISLGLTSKELAKRMNISPNTVRAFLRLIMIKMEVSTRGGVVAKILDRAKEVLERKVS